MIEWPHSDASCPTRCVRHYEQRPRAFACLSFSHFVLSVFRTAMLILTIIPLRCQRFWHQIETSWQRCCTWADNHSVVILLCCHSMRSKNHRKPIAQTSAGAAIWLCSCSAMLYESNNGRWAARTEDISASAAASKCAAYAEASRQAYTRSESADCHLSIAWIVLGLLPWANNAHARYTLAECQENKLAELESIPVAWIQARNILSIRQCVKGMLSSEQNNGAVSLMPG